MWLVFSHDRLKNRTFSGFKRMSCNHCDGDGYSPFARSLKRKWYGYDIPIQHLHGGNWMYAPGYSHFSAWAYNLEQCDLEALWEANRLQEFFGDRKPSLEELNKLMKLTPSPRGAMYCCVSARCKATGEPIECQFCQGHG